MPVDLPPGAPMYPAGPLATVRPTNLPPVVTPSAAQVRASGMPDLLAYMRPRTATVAQAVPGVVSQAQGWADRARQGMLSIFGLDVPPPVQMAPPPVVVPPTAVPPPQLLPVSEVYKRRVAGYSK